MRLWDKGESVDVGVHAFTVGNDPEIDRRLVAYDVLGSAAQARMLAKIGVLDAKERGSIIGALREIMTVAERGEFEIPFELEDCHTALEAHLTKQLGDAGKKIHTGRSRNDQVLVTTRLYLRSSLLELLGGVARCVETLGKRYPELKDCPLPGYTHLQPAMPSSVGMWVHSFYEDFLQLLKSGLTLLEEINANPLGAASGFGVNLELDLEETTKLLGFSRFHRSPIEAQNSRGRYELKVLRWGADLVCTVEKLAWDMLLYSTREFGFFRLPLELTTGSSIMPQKHNPDVLELLRGHAARVRGAATDLEWVIGKLPSNYHRDFQLTKEPLMRGIDNLGAMLFAINQVLAKIEVDRERCEAAMTDDLYVTYDAFALVRDGMPFREAYRASATRLKEGKVDRESLSKEFSIVASRIHSAMDQARGEFKKSNSEVENWRSKLQKVRETLLSSS